MPELPAWLQLVLVLAIVGIAAAVWVIAERRRRDALVRAAREIGLEFPHPSNDLMAGGLRRLGVFEAGSRAEFRDVMMRRDAARDTYVFGYSYDSGTRVENEPSRREHTVAAFRLRGAGLPGFELSKEGWLSRLAALGGFQDLVFDHHPEFSRRFLLRGEDETAIRALFDSTLLAFFERLPADWNQTVEGRGEWLVVYRKDSRLKPDEIPAFVRQAQAIADRLA